VKDITVELFFIYVCIEYIKNILFSWISFLFFVGRMSKKRVKTGKNRSKKKSKTIFET